MYVCLCNAITDKQIRRAAAGGARTVTDLTDQLGVAACCGACHDTAAEILAAHRPRDKHFRPIVFSPTSA